MKDLNLLTLTINIKHIPTADIPMMVAILKSAFGGVEKMYFVESENDGTSRSVSLEDERLSGLVMKKTWREMCLNYYQSHRLHSYFFKFDLLKVVEDDLHDMMSCDGKFFDYEFYPLSPKDSWPVSK